MDRCVQSGKNRYQPCKFKKDIIEWIMWLRFQPVL